MDVFWLKQRSIGRLHVCIGRNDAIYGMKKTRYGGFVSRFNGNLFITISIGSRFLNVDIV